MTTRKDLTNQRFGKLRVLEFVKSNGHDSIYKCVCDCGNICEVRRYALIQGRQISCGCYKQDKFDIIGQKFGRLEVIEYSHSNNGLFWKCRCDCGNITIVSGGNLRNKSTLSCGCLKKEYQLTRTDHGLSNHPLYKIWVGMKDRCDQPTHPAYKYYGGKGIIYCDRWLEFELFYYDNIDKYNQCLLKYPNEKPSIERINNEDNYYYDNCIFIPLRYQVYNKTNSKLSFDVIEEIRNNTVDSVYELSVKYNVHQNTIRNILNNKTYNNIKSSY